MIVKSKLLFILSFFTCLSCTTINLERKVEPPLKSYVKVYHTVSIKSCHKKYADTCPVGEYQSMGSGMLVDFIEDQSIVVTAGHVCTTEVNQKISEYSEEITVLDFKGFKHTGHVIKSTENDSKGGVDMCALWVPTLKQKGITFSSFPPRAGQEIYYIGSPQGIYHPPVAPILTGIYSGQMNVSNALVSIPATSGSSGSAILDMNNKMVGVLWAAHEFHHVSIATSWHASALFLYEVTKMYNGKSKLKIGPIKN